ncbi:hypothetical protein [Qipengyuania sp.]|uniref:hypothetical protein n=1 Tax=Qipengyuania sp. TaxID=2004515 RepID=UPI0035133CA3
MAAVTIGGGAALGGGVAISWPALLAAAAVVVVVAIVVVAVVAFIDWLSTPSRPKPPRPLHRRCNLRPGSPPGECEYACYIVYSDGTMSYTHDMTITLAKLSELLGRKVTQCPPFIISP